MTTSCSLACNGVAGLAQRKPFQPQLARALYGKAEYFDIPQSQETLNNLGAKSLKFDPAMTSVPSMNDFIRQQQQINSDYAKELARIGAGAALEIGATALIPAGMGIGAKVGTKLLKHVVGKAISRAIGQGAFSGGLSGGLSGTGHGLMTNQNPVVTGIAGIAGGALGGSALGGIGGYATKMNNASKLIYHKPFDEMNRNEARLYKGLGKDYYKDYIQSRPVENPYIGKINFSSEQASKPNYKFMEQYPTLRKNLKNANDNIWVAKNKDREDAYGFNNMKVNFNNKNYDYQVRENSNNQGNFFYNIKPYEIFEQELKNNMQKKSKLYDLIYRGK